MVKRSFISCLLTCAAAVSFAQKDSVSRRVRNERIWIATGANAVFWTGSYITLNEAWYAGYPRTGFHYFNDNGEWNQMDKAGHAWTSYTLSRSSARMWKWTGVNDKTAAILGGGTGFIYQGIIEMQDAYSSQWGFSWGDIGSNAFGSGLYVGQQLLWREQKVLLKMSYTGYEYRSPSLLARRNNLFGNSFAERILKDYNAQKYWASVNLASLLSTSAMPAWLNIAVGYGSDGMYGARNNRWTDKNGISHDYTTTERVRRFYLSPDIDLSRIQTRSKVLKPVLFILNIVKIPAPALELNSRGKLQMHALLF